MISGGYDVTFDCVGSAKSIEESLKWTAARGQVVLLATGHGRGADLTPLWFGELTVLGSYGRSVEKFAGESIHTYALVQRFMQQDLSALQGLLTHTFAVAEYRQALRTVGDKAGQGSVKVAFSFP
jgi:threonine dehydrogenase-like Zn-dependent dehydrogenase